MLTKYARKLFTNGTSNAGVDTPLKIYSKSNNINTISWAFTFLTTKFLLCFAKFSYSIIKDFFKIEKYILNYFKD